ncbi:MAG: TlpA family protein disulfide reductase, partial [Saprospiraceae bacterium]
MVNKIYLFIILASVFTYSGCFVPQNPFTGLAPGTWRAVLKLDPAASGPRGDLVSEATKKQFEEVTLGYLPFT